LPAMRRALRVVACKSRRVTQNKMAARGSSMKIAEPALMRGRGASGR